MDILDLEETGGIFEARLTRITKDTTADYVDGSDGITYHVKLETYEEDDDLRVKIGQMRKRASHAYNIVDLDIGMKVMVNYNIEAPEDRGFWYDAKVTGLKLTLTTREYLQ